VIDAATKSRYTPTIGIECHVQLKTVTKLFAAVKNDARDAEPNTLISHICLGMPGALPVLNEQAVQFAIRAALALGTRPAALSVFERKHYFYPDLPMGYQISQLHQPIIVGGQVNIIVGDTPKSIGITRAQLEADAGKSTHPAGQDYSLVDLNRAGTPLLEIVSEPEMHSAEEAKAYAKELYLLMRYASVSDCDLYYGNMRFDVNVSVSKDKNMLGTRSETKNLNSFRSVEKAVEYEINRQIELLEKGGMVIQETLGWDDAKQKTFSQRTKEDANDYRYFPDPDLPLVVTTDDMVAAVQQTMPVMPGEWRKRLGLLGLDTSQTNTLLEAEIESETISYLSIIEQSLNDTDFAKTLANWLVNIEIPLRRSNEQILSGMKDDQRLAFLREVFAMQSAGKLSSTSTKNLISDILKSGAQPDDLEKYAAEQGYIQVSDEAEIAKIVAQVIQENPQAAQDVKNGEQKAIGFLTGQVMKKSLGKANPALAQELIKRQLT
jgi:aspartyl-tRNA(Asn)/glutamyl-tRNA(Gln) amidotransferase subunit B